jgi:LysM repeat protein
MQWKRLVFYLLINVLVSASTTFVVLNIWENRQQAELQRATSDVVIPVVNSTQDEQPAEPTLVPTIPLLIHQVRSGETLGDIAEEYEVTIDELMEINGLADADAIGVGQVIYVPDKTEQAPTPLPVESENTVQGQVEIVSVVGVGDLNSERLIIGEAGGGKHSLAGWQILDEDENVYTFPQATLYENGQIVLNSKAGVDNPLELFWGLPQPVWESGEMISLVDASGQEQASFQVP